MPKEKTKNQAWVSSEGKKLLDRDIRKGFVTRTMPLEQVYDRHRVHYQICGRDHADALRLFPGRLKSAFARAELDQNRAAQEEAAMIQDRITHPRPAVARGKEQWEGSRAQRKLKDDVTNHIHVGKTVAEFRATRHVYQKLTVREFGKKLEQELKLRKWKENYPKRIKSIPANHH